MADDSDWAVDVSARPRAVDDFEIFVRTETGSLLRTAHLITGDASSAEDLVQETLTRLYPKWGRVQAASFPAAYVRRAMINNFVNSKRSRASRELVSSDVVAGASPARGVDTADEVATHESIMQLLATLPDRQRAALVLSYFDDLPAADVARILGCRVGTARSLVSRGLAALREAMTWSADHD